MIDWDIPIAPELPTPDEAKALGELVLAGDTAAREALILGCRKLAATEVKELLQRHDKLFGLVDGGDLHSAALLGLMQGVRDLRNTDNVLAYLTRCVRNQIADEIKRYARQATPPVSDYPLLDWEYSPWPSEWAIGTAINEVTKHAMDPARERKLLWLRREGRTYAEIAAETGMALATVGRRIRDYREKMKNLDAADEKSGQDESLMRIEEHKSNPNGETAMDPTLKTFVETNTHRRPDARIKLCDLVGKFRATLDGREAKLWPKWRFAKELEAGGYVMGKDSDRVVFIAGLTFQPPRQWTVDEAGRLRLETVA